MRIIIAQIVKSTPFQKAFEFSSRFAKYLGNNGVWGREAGSASLTAPKEIFAPYEGVAAEQ
jgi:hypothetical protein